MIIYGRGLRTHPWGEPVLRVRVEDRWEPGRTDHAQVEAGWCRFISLLMRMSRMVVLKAELKSMNSSLT